MLFKKVKLFVPGGRLAIDAFTNLVELCKLIGVNHFQFGRRQEIIIRIPKGRINHFERSIKGFQYELEKESGYIHHNIVSSFLSHEISPATTYWLRSSITLDILDSIDWLPTIRVSVTDLKQDMIYSFTGDINFIPSDQENFWHVYLRNRDGGNLWYFPFLIHSDDIHRVVAVYESEHKKDDSIENKISSLHNQLEGRLTPTSYEPQINISEFSNYEGIHNYGDDKYWLGIYKRETRFQFSELENIVSLCKQHMIGHINITTWKSLLIKDIVQENLTDWKLLLAQNGLNIGHSQAELNWQINDFDDDAHELKAYLRKEIAANDVASTGVIIGINNDKNYSFSHIIIEKTPLLKMFGTNEVSTYTIYTRKYFNPTFNEFNVYKKWVTKRGLLQALEGAFQKYYDKAFKEPATFTAKPIQIKKESILQEKVINSTVHQCQDCGTVYFSEIGDMNQDIIPGTSFKTLPDSYACSMCEAPKKSFTPIEKSKLAIVAV